MIFQLYLDPGMGSMLLQAGIAAIAAAGVFLFAIRARLSAFFKKIFKCKNSTTKSTDEEHDDSK